jgi:hypothetical protein
MTLKPRLLALAGLLWFGLNAMASDTRPTTEPKPFISYFLPTPPHVELVRETWGATNVLPRDI